MADLIVTTDFSQVDRLNTALKSTDTIFVKAVDSVLRESNRFNRITKVLAKTTEETLAVVEAAETIVATKVQQESMKREKARAKEAAAAEREAKRIEIAAKKAADAEAKAAQEAANAIIKAQKNRADFAWAMALQRQKEADAEARAAEKVVAAHNKVAYAAQESSKGSRQSELFIQQLGYQVGDFAVQVQSGTSALVAFAQQGTQILGFLPMAGAFGAVAGAVLAVSTAILNLGFNFASASNEAKKAKEALEGFKSSFSTLESAQNAAKEAQDRYTQAIYLSGQTQIQVSPQIIQALALEADAQDRLLRVEQSRFELKKFELEKTISQQRQLVAGLMQEVNLLQDPDASSAAYTRTQQESARLELVKAIVANNKELFLSLTENQAQLDLINSLLGGADTEFESILAKAKELGVVIPGIDFSAPISAARTLAEELGVSVGLAARLSSKGLDKIIYDPRDPRYDPVAAEMAKIQANPGTVSPFDPSRQPKVDSTGGVGGSSDSNTGLDTLINQLQTERETIQEWYDESQTLLKSSSEAELQILGGYNEAKLRLEKEYQGRLKGIRDEANYTALGDAATFFGGMAAVTQAGGEKTVKAMRIFSAAQALINSYVAFTEVLKDPSFIGRPFARFGAAASALASGLGAVAAIKGGSGGSGGVGSATVAQSGASAAAPQTVYIDSISPESLYSGETLIKLFDSFYDENDKRGKVFMVAR